MIPTIGRVGNSDVAYALDTKRGTIQIRLPLPPSTNERQTIGYKKTKNGTRPVFVLTSKARNYLKDYSLILRSLAMSLCLKPFDNYTFFYFKFFMSNPAYDSHNALKILADCLEKGLIIKNDVFLVPRFDIPNIIKNQNSYVLVGFKLNKSSV